MKRKLIVIPAVICMVGLLSARMYAESGPAGVTQPPIAQPLIREGDLAIRLVETFRLGRADSEAEAENMLANAGIIPRNGWMADYPVTPDIIGELTDSISAAADAKRLNMERQEALQALLDVTSGENLPVAAGAPGQPSQAGSYSPPDATVINNYYYEQGPPVVTYYPPPPDYFYLYAWVPYPFWGWNCWFHGYYILYDFHKVAHVHGRVEVISNHFVDHRTNRIVRIDPVKRFNGRTYAGIGAPYNTKRFVSVGNRGTTETMFRGSRERAMQERKRTSALGGEGRSHPPVTHRAPSGNNREHR